MPSVSSAPIRLAISKGGCKFVWYVLVKLPVLRNKNKILPKFADLNALFLPVLNASQVLSTNTMAPSLPGVFSGRRLTNSRSPKVSRNFAQPWPIPRGRGSNAEETNLCKEETKILSCTRSKSMSLCAFW